MAKGISLVGFKTQKEVEEYIHAYPDACFELSYAMSQSFLKEVAPLIKNRVISIHACCPSQPCFPNFGSADPQVIRESEEAVMKSAETALAFGAKVMVLHPGYLTDERVSSRYAERAKLMEGTAFAPFTGRGEGAIARADITSMDEYLKRFEIMRGHIERISERLEKLKITLAVENLNPRAGYLNITSEDFFRFGKNIYFCLDVGHLWVSHFVFGFDFLPAVKRILSTGRVVNMHLHSNASDGTILEDTHDDFYSNSFPAREIIAMASSLPLNLVLETVKNPLENTRFLDSLFDDVTARQA